MQAPTQKEIVKIIRERRKTLGYNQEEIAEKIGLSQSGYASIENEVSEIKISHLINLVELLEIENILVNRDQETTEPPSLEITRELAQALKIELHTLQEIINKILQK